MIDHGDEALRVTGAVASVGIWGYTLNEWVALFTIIYLVFQIFILVPKAAAIVKRCLHGRTE